MGTLWWRLAPVVVAGCGLFASEPELPDPEAVAAARLRDAGEWQLLAGAVALVEEQGRASLPALEELAAQNPESLRLRAYLQDVEMSFAERSADRERIRERYAEAARQSPTAEDVYLAARVANSDAAPDWIDLALDLDGDLVPAQVLRIGIQATARDTEALDRLVDLLDDHPGSAEGWRLLGYLAPVFARPELARRAAETEPWVPGHQETMARLVRAGAALDSEDPAGALDALVGLEGREADLLRAAALTQGGRIDLAEPLLARLVQEAPEDPVARFDYGLLALNYLGRPGLARQQLEAFLALARSGAEVPLQRQLQAEYWLDRLPPPSQP